MSAKLHINVAQGVIDVEGDATFVQSIYNDFKQYLLLRIGKESAGESNDAEKEADVKPPRTRTRRPRRAVKSEGAKLKTTEYTPKFDSNLDLSELEPYYSQFLPKNHPEKILIFAMFLRDKLQKVPCAADDIFTCYQSLPKKTKTPEAFVQALRDAQNKGKRVIDFASVNEIKVTISGTNYFNQELARAKLDA